VAGAGGERHGEGTVMNAGALTVAALLALGASCGNRPAPAPGPPAAATATAAQGTADLDDARRGIPRVDGNDVSPPLITTRTTVLEHNRPAVVVTLPEAVLFDFGSADLRPDAEGPLHAVADILRQKPDASAEVAGHTDAVGSATYNQALSLQRATAVVDWLVDHGVPRDRLRPVGYGATRPVAGNATDDDRRRNRRVELTVS
jgi:OOP family OmpA-OmpF porin